MILLKSEPVLEKTELNFSPFLILNRFILVLLYNNSAYPGLSQAKNSDKQAKLAKLKEEISSYVEWQKELPGKDEKWRVSRNKITLLEKENASLEK